MGTGDRPVELAAFDLDGTLLRGDTVCEAIARKLGKLERMREFEQARTIDEIRHSREVMARWYRPYSIDELAEPLPGMRLAPGTREAFDVFREYGVTTAIVSLTWDFAVEFFAEELGADYSVGTTYHPDGTISHFWPADKPVWVRELTEELGIGMDQVVSAGDSGSDAHLLRATGQSFFVGDALPDGLDGTRHVPDADIRELATAVLDPA